LVTVVGLLPLMFQIHPDFGSGIVESHAPGSDIWVHLSGAVVWGLTFSTLLTLVLTPVLLAAPKVMAARFGRIFGWSRRRLGLAPKKRALQPATANDLPQAAE
jgi:multidrug efflux pump